MYLVFSQEPKGLSGTDRLAAHAARFFGSELEVVERSSSRLRVRLSSHRPFFNEEFTIGERAASSEAAYLTLAAVCASVALGPVLPPDHSTLFGVRGALERRDKLA